MQTVTVTTVINTYSYDVSICDFVLLAENSSTKFLFATGGAEVSVHVGGNSTC